MMPVLPEVEPMSLLNETTTSSCDGVVVVDKPSGWTSHDVVAKVRGLLCQRRIGHAGTLDPDATGVLPLLIGRGTRVAEYLVEWDKEYEAVLRLGVSTDTQDATGAVLSTKPLDGLGVAQVEKVIAQFAGVQQQVPPMYSAVKIGGVPLYKAARAGRVVERQARTVTFHRIEITDCTLPHVRMRVTCSKGTYIRTLCADIGEALGVGGHLASLRRTRVGPFGVDQAVSLEDVAMRAAEGTVSGVVWSIDQVLRDLPTLVVPESVANRVVHGAPIAMADGTWEWGKGADRPQRTVRIKNDQGVLLALGEIAPPFLTGPHVGSGRNGQAIRIHKVLVETQ